MFNIKIVFQSVGIFFFNFILLFFFFLFIYLFICMEYIPQKEGAVCFDFLWFVECILFVLVCYLLITKTYLYNFDPLNHTFI